MGFYFKLQYNRLIRSLKDWGMNPLLGMLLSPVAFVLVSTLFFKRIAYAQFIYPLLAVALVYPLGSIKRNGFLKGVFTLPRYRQVRLAENLLLAAPFCVFLLTRQLYLHSLLTLLACAACSVFNNIGKGGIVIPTPFYKKPFEFIIGFRKNIVWLLCLYLIAGIALWVNNYALGMFILLVVSLLCMGFLNQPEPEFYVWVHSQTAREFLKQKVKTAITHTLYVCMPLTIAFIVLSPKIFYVPMLIMFVGLLYVSLGAVSKYASYPGQLALLPVLKLTLGVIFPPAMLLLIPHFYSLSVKRLNTYLE